MLSKNKASKRVNQRPEKIFEEKKKFHRKRSELPIEEKIKILVELQKMGKISNPEKTKGKKVWEI